MIVGTGGLAVVLAMVFFPFEAGRNEDKQKSVEVKGAAGFVAFRGFVSDGDVFRFGLQEFHFGASGLAGVWF